MKRLCPLSLAAAAILACTACNYHKVIERESLGEYFRMPQETSNVYADKVFEYTPAPGQFIGEPTITEYPIRTPEAACAWAKERLDNKKFVSLGGFGGYIVVGFDHSIVALDGYDFAVYGNAVSGGSEPGIVWVMQDANGNGAPDDVWYELRGSESFAQDVIRPYSVTYYRPDGPGQDVRWRDSEGAEGTIDYLGAYHKQDSYYPGWIAADQYTLTGTRLKAHNFDQSGNGTMWINPDYAWGYADNFGSTYFCIRDAADPSGNPVELKYIDFIKVQTALNTKSGWIGENSTEVLGFEDLSINFYLSLP